MILISEAKRRRRERLVLEIEQAMVSYDARSGWIGGPCPPDMQWLTRELLLAWNELDLLHRLDARDRREKRRLNAALEGIIRRLARASG